MATNTTYFDLSKPAYSDTADIATINGNMDKVDTSLNGLGKGLAIVAKNNTHDAVSKGEYVYVHGHGSLAEGLYRATNNIPANAALSNSNLTAASGGIGTQVASIAEQTESKISNTILGSYGSRTDAAQGIIESMSNGTVKIGWVGITGVSNYMVLAFKYSATNAVVMFINAANSVRIVYLNGSTYTETTITGS